MGSRMMPLECPHGKVLDWGDFGEGPGEKCAVCDASTAHDQIDALTAERDRLVALLGRVGEFLFDLQHPFRSEYRASAFHGAARDLCREIAAVMDNWHCDHCGMAGDDEWTSDHTIAEGEAHSSFTRQNGAVE
jgi:hypothetical protein